MGECIITLQDAQQLAVEAGFTFKGSHDTLPLARRADLQGGVDRRMGLREEGRQWPNVLAPS
jgi:hypothetical protein